jgi:hypothetical protein
VESIDALSSLEKVHRAVAHRDLEFLEENKRTQTCNLLFIGYILATDLN